MNPNNLTQIFEASLQQINAENLHSSAAPLFLNYFVTCLLYAMIINENNTIAIDLSVLISCWIP